MSRKSVHYCPRGTSSIAAGQVAIKTLLALPCDGVGVPEGVHACQAIQCGGEFLPPLAAVVWKALRSYRGSAGDFADCLIERSAAAAGCEKTVTLDRGAVKARGMTLIS